MIVFTLPIALPVHSSNSLEGDREKIILVMGDSISAAYGMSLDDGWVALLDKTLVNLENDHQIINASISGETSSGGQRRLKNLLEKYKPTMVVLELGGNDGLRGYPTTLLKNNLISMTRLALKFGAQVLILPMEIPPNYGSRYTNMFRKAYVEAADATGATLGPFVLKDIALNKSMMQSDGIHPTKSAQPLIKDAVLKTLLPLLTQ